MSTVKILVTLGGLGAIAAIVWFFWLKRPEGTRAAITSGWRERVVLVKRGYVPDTIVATAGKPLRLIFNRQEAAPCSKVVVFDAFHKSVRLPEGQPTTVELPPSAPGEYALACQMGMLRGRLLVESPAH